MECMPGMGGHGGASVLDLLQEGRKQEGSCGENFCQAQMKLSYSLCAELAGEDALMVR